jgi:Skp family chaperone for outer membrane proteins
MQLIMRSIIVVLTICVALPAAAGNIGFLDAERAVGSVKEGQRQLQALEAWANPKRRELESMQTRVAELTQQLNAQRTIASAEAISQLEKELVQARRDFEDAGRAFNRDLESKQNEFLAQVATRVGTVASEYAAANGFDAIFVLNAQPLVFVAEGADITDTVIKVYDEKYPVD